jgi:hypothetical protein
MSRRIMTAFVITDDLLTSTECQKACPPVFEPVCGMNNKSYANKCRMECDGVELKHEGRCPINPPSDEAAVTDEGEIPEPCSSPKYLLAFIIETLLLPFVCTVNQIFARQRLQERCTNDTKRFPSFCGGLGSYFTGLLDRLFFVLFSFYATVHRKVRWKGRQLSFNLRYEVKKIDQVLFVALSVYKFSWGSYFATINVSSLFFLASGTLANFHGLVDLFVWFSSCVDETRYSH